MLIRSLVLSALLCSYAVAAAAQSSVAPTPHAALAAPRYIGPLGVNPNPSVFAAVKPKSLAVSTLGNVGKIVTPGSRKSVCYAIHAYAITPESDTVGITHATSESTCVAAETSTMKQTVEPAGGPEFR